MFIPLGEGRAVSLLGDQRRPIPFQTRWAQAFPGSLWP